MTEWQLVRCTRCKTVKPAKDFSTNANRKTGVQAHCKACCAEARRLRYRRDPDQQNQEKLQGQVSDAARRELAMRYPDDYRELIDQERLKRGLGRSHRSPN